jgi:RNA polymerase sigma-70 factor (ECF subfamily)
LEKASINIHGNLIEQAKKNSSQAQGKLYQLYYKAIYNSCLRLVNDRFTAEDLMQEAFIYAFKNIAQYREQASFGAWLKKIAINLSINYLKRKELLEEKLTQWKENEESHEETAIYSFQLTDIKLAMKELAQQYRLVFSLYLIEGYDHEEIAGILGISASTSRSQLSRAKQKIKEIVVTKKSLQHETP